MQIFLQKNIIFLHFATSILYISSPHLLHSLPSYPPFPPLIPTISPLHLSAKIPLFSHFSKFFTSKIHFFYIFLHSSFFFRTFAADFETLCPFVRKKIVIIICILYAVLCTPAFAQVSSAGRSVFSFMSLPTSARLNALGGSNVSLSDGDISMGMCFINRKSSVR